MLPTNHRRTMLNRRQSIETNISTGTTTSSDAMAALRDIPKMDLLPISYVNRKSIVPPDASKHPHVGQSNSISSRFDNIVAFKKQVIRKSQTVRSTSVSPAAAQKPPVKSSYNPLKYVVYKKHNQVAESKLQYVNDTTLNSSSPKTVPKKRFFENDRKSKSKLDTIQFVFDNKDYERHVDNKMYDCIGLNASEYTGDRCNSWQYRKHPQMGFALKQPMSTRDAKIAPMRQKFMQTKSAPPAIVTDATRIRQMFDSRSSAEFTDETAGSLKKVKKLVDNFENRCSCKEEKPLPSVPKSRIPPGTIHRKATRKGLHSSSNDVRSIFEESLSKIITKRLPDPKIAIKKLDDLTSEKCHQTCGYTKCSLQNVTVSSSSTSLSIETSARLYGDDRCQSPGSISTDTLQASEKSAKMIDKSVGLPCGLPTAESIKNMKNIKEIKAISEINDKFIKAALNINNPVAIKHIHKDEFNVVRHLNRKLSNMSISLPLDDIQKNSTKSMSSFFINQSTQEDTSTDSSTDMGYFGSIIASDASEISSASSTSSASSLREKRLSLKTPTHTDPKPKHSSRLPIRTSSKYNQPVDQLQSTSQRMSRLFPSRPGCDGAIFWNDCYYYDDEPVIPTDILPRLQESDCNTKITSNETHSFNIDQVGFSCKMHCQYMLYLVFCS